MKKMLTILLGLLVCGWVTAGPPNPLKEVAKPDDDAAEVRAMQGHPVPEGWKDIPFEETNPEPVLTAEEKARGWMLFQREITEIVYAQTRPRAEERVGALIGFGTPGEFEPLTFSLYPTRELKNLKVRVSDLATGENIIGADNIDVHLVTYWNVRYPRYLSDKTYRRVPELMEQVTAHTSPARECQRYWLRIRLPEDAAAGLYRGAVTVWDEGHAKAIRIPILFRVLNFKLQQDPRIQYTAYNYDLHREVDEVSGRLSKRAQAKGKEWIYQAAANDYQTMADYGFNAHPTIYLRYDRKGKKLYIPQADRVFAAIKKAGLKGPVPLVGTGMGSLYSEHTGKRIGRHSRVPVMPPEALYTQLTRMIKELEVLRKEKGWPEFIYVPIDEVASECFQFGVNVYKAVKDAGVRTYATKNPKLPDAAHYKEYIDFWCSQPFAASYDEASTVEKGKGYWSYPNHVTNETRVPKVMSKGGRMTYGYGLWRSGYTLLIPWIWRWEIGNTRDFLDGKYSDVGMLVADDGTIIPTPYWECFREGVDDLRYLYTLQAKVLSHRHSSNAKILAHTSAARADLQRVWNAIPVMLKYKYEGIWPDDTFQALRWQAARHTAMLSKYPGPAVNAPSVIVKDTSARPPIRESIFEREAKRGNLEILDLGDEDLGQWEANTGETKLKLTDEFAHKGKHSLLMTVDVNHKTDGGGEAGQYPVGWPRIRTTLKEPIDITKYDYFAFWMRIDSDRDEVEDDLTPFNMTLWADGKKMDLPLFEEAEQRVWFPVVMPISYLAGQIGQPEKLKKTTHFQVWIGESRYRHGVHLKFYLDEFSLVRLKKPAFAQVILPREVLLPMRYLMCDYQLLGLPTDLAKGTYAVQAVLADPAGQELAAAEKDAAANPFIALDTLRLKPGIYAYTITVKDAEGNQMAEITKPVRAIAGPIFRR